MAAILTSHEDFTGPLTRTQTQLIGYVSEIKTDAVLTEFGQIDAGESATSVEPKIPTTFAGSSKQIQKAWHY